MSSVIRHGVADMISYGVVYCRSEKINIGIFPLFLSVLIWSCQPKDPWVVAQTRYPMLTPCSTEGLSEEILCGTIEVFEDQISKKGKKIPLDVFLFPTFNLDPSSSVFIDYNGGPGVPNNLLIPLYEKGGFLSSFRDVRDVLIVDKRGTGASNITCGALDSIPLPLNHYLFNTDFIANCLSEIQSKVDLSNYNTASQVEDLEAVRQWLGIEQYDFHGISYGTRVGLELIRKYPKNINSAILTGTAPPNFGLFEFVDVETERVLQKLILRCDTDSTCSSNFPRFKEELYQLRSDIKDSSVLYRYTHEDTNNKYDIEFTDYVYIGMVANMFHSGNKLEQLPAIIKEASSGNFSPLIRANISSHQLAIPLHLSQFCPEESNRHPVENIEAFDTLFTKGMGALTEFNACQVWQQLPTPEWLSEPIGGGARLLLFSGEDDVLTPPRMNDSIGQLFPNSRHVIFKDQGHAYTDWSCWESIIYQFLEGDGEGDPLDISCATKIKRSAFSLL